MTDLTREVWINRCAARFASRASISIEEAIPLAEICLDDICEGDLTESPEDMADVVDFAKYLRSKVGNLTKRRRDENEPK